MIYLLAASLAYGLFVTILYLIVQARVDEYDAEAHPRPASKPTIPAQRNHN